MKTLANGIGHFGGSGELEGLGRLAVPHYQLRKVKRCLNANIKRYNGVIVPILCCQIRRIVPCMHCCLLCGSRCCGS